MTAFDTAWQLVKMPNLAGETLFHDDDRDHPDNRYHYMVNDGVWNEAGLDYHQNPTIDELEALIGRTLTVDDFTFAPINWHSRIEEGRWPTLYPHEYKTMGSRIGGEGRGKLREAWIRDEMERLKGDPGSAFFSLIGNAGMSLDELSQYMSEEELAQVAPHIEYRRHWERENPEKAKEILEHNTRYRTAWGE